MVRNIRNDHTIVSLGGHDCGGRSIDPMVWARRARRGSAFKNQLVVRAPPQVKPVADAMEQQDEQSEEKSWRSVPVNERTALISPIFGLLAYYGNVLLGGISQVVQVFTIGRRCRFGGSCGGRTPRRRWSKSSPRRCSRSASHHSRS